MGKSVDRISKHLAIPKRSEYETTIDEEIRITTSLIRVLHPSRDKRIIMFDEEKREFYDELDRDPDAELLYDSEQVAVNELIQTMKGIRGRFSPNWKYLNKALKELHVTTFAEVSAILAQVYLIQAHDDDKEKGEGLGRKVTGVLATLGFFLIYRWFFHLGFDEKAVDQILYSYPVLTFILWFAASSSTATIKKLLK